MNITHQELTIPDTPIMVLDTGPNRFGFRIERIPLLNEEAEWQDLLNRVFHMKEDGEDVDLEELARKHEPAKLFMMIGEPNIKKALMLRPGTYFEASDSFYVNKCSVYLQKEADREKEVIVRITSLETIPIG